MIVIVILIKAMDSGFRQNDALEKIFKKRYNNLLLLLLDTWRLALVTCCFYSI